MSSPRVTFNLTCGKGVTELLNLTNLLSSFAEPHQMQQKNFDVSPYVLSCIYALLILDYITVCITGVCVMVVGREWVEPRPASQWSW